MTNPQRPSDSSEEQGRGINDPLTSGDEDGLEEVEQATSQSRPTIITREVDTDCVRRNAESACLAEEARLKSLS